jgi:hypothetical protein
MQTDRPNWGGDCSKDWVVLACEERHEVGQGAPAVRCARKQREAAVAGDVGRTFRRRMPAGHARAGRRRRLGTVSDGLVRLRATDVSSLP